jgi:hypothetical protein
VEKVGCGNPTRPANVLDPKTNQAQSRAFHAALHGWRLPAVVSLGTKIVIPKEFANMAMNAADVVPPLLFLYILESFSYIAEDFLILLRDQR